VSYHIKIIIIIYISSYLWNVCLLSRAEIYDHSFGVFIIWDDTMETRCIENTSLEYFENMNQNGIFQCDGNNEVNSLTVQSSNSIEGSKDVIDGNNEVINLIMTDNSVVDHVKIAAVAGENNLNSSVDLTQMEEGEEIIEIDHGDEIGKNDINDEIGINDINDKIGINDINDEYGIDDIDHEIFQTSEDVDFGDEDDAVDAFGRPLWRKKLNKVLAQFKDAVIRVDRDSLRIIRFPQRDNLLDDAQFQNWFIIPENIYADEDRLLKDFFDLDSAKGKSAHVITISGREREFTTFHYPLDNHSQRNKSMNIRRKLGEYVESIELQVIYRYEVKSAISLMAQCGNARVRRNRLFISYCYLACNKSKKFQSKRFILVSILTTLCIAPYNLFVIWDTKFNWMIEWQGEDIIKYFWCDFVTEVNYVYLRGKLDSHFAKKILLRLQSNYS
jgi:hypothetical protein